MYSVLENDSEQLKKVRDLLQLINIDLSSTPEEREVRIYATQNNKNNFQLSVHYDIMMCALSHLLL